MKGNYKESIENPTETSYNESKRKAVGDDPELASLLRSVDGAAQYDACVKQLLGRKDILSYILLYCAKEFKGMDPKAVEGLIEAEPRVGDALLDPGLTNSRKGGSRIVGMNTEDVEVNEGLIRFDIVFRVRCPGGTIEIIVNVEAQMRMPQGYPILNRVIFYIARLISSQKDRDFVGTHYEDIRRVYSIWICMNMDENSLTSVSLDKNDVINAFPLEGSDLGLLNIVLVGLTSEPCEREEGHELHRLLGTLLSMDMPPKEKLEILEDEYGIAKDKQREEEMNEMCNLSLGILERGWKQGIEEGIEQGLSRGREEGIEQGREEGREEGIEQGLSRGREEGESKATALFRILLSADRIEDLRRASEDDDYRKELYAEYGIE